MAFTALPLAGEIVSAAKWQALFTEVRPLSSRLSADTSPVVNNTLVASGLSVAVAANKVYSMELHVYYNGPSAAADIKIAFTYPTGATALIVSTGVNTSDTFNVSSAQAESVAHTFGTSATLDRSCSFAGQWVIGANAGNITVQWAQNTTTAVNSVLRAGTRLVLRQQE